MDKPLPLELKRTFRELLEEKRFRFLEEEGEGEVHRQLQLEEGEGEVHRRRRERRREERWRRERWRQQLEVHQLLRLEQLNRQLRRRREERTAAYKKALSEGEVVNVAYSRVFFLGTAGVGKSSFKNSLMKLPWDPKANSTIISDVSCVRPFAKGLLSEQWEAVTHEAEIEAMAHLFSAVSKDQKYQSVLFDFSNLIASSTINDTASNKLDSVLKEISDFPVLPTKGQLEPHLLMHFWDCGGQPAFLEILPVFLTSRTTFLLHFDASKDLNSKWQSVHHIDGIRYDGEEVNMSTLTYMLNWMACVHSHLTKYGADGSIPDYPRMYCIGTHGDLLTDRKKGQVRSELISHYKDKEYAKLISDTLIIDNTSSGKGESEDPNFEVVRSAIIDITRNKLIVKTPISWVLFRKVLQVLEENIVSLSFAMEVGYACDIPPEDVHLVLLFYHDLGSVLYYPQLKGLKEKVIVDPKFFIDALGKIFTFQAGTTHVREWEVFHQYGILIQPLYTSVWKECGDLKPEDFIEVLLCFRLAAQVEEDQICSSQYKQYFIPAFLKLCQDSTIATHSKELETASPLHIRFETGFVPPGFFTRFVAVIAAHPKTTLYLQKGVYRNRVTFRYEDEKNRSIEHLTVTDQHDVIQVNVHRPNIETDPAVPLSNVCQDILVLLEDSAEEVENILQNSIGRGFEELPKYSVPRFQHFVCDGCPVSSKVHYLTPAKYQVRYPTITCEVNTTYRPLTENEKNWFTEKVEAKDMSSKAKVEVKSKQKDESLGPTIKGTKVHVQSNIDVHKINDGVQETQTDKRLDIKDLATILQELSLNQKFDYAAKWKQLGLYLGLYQPTLKAIEVNCRGQVWDCLMECISSWLKGEDGVRETRGGGSNWISLVAALDAMGEREVANNIRIKYLQ